MPYTLSGRHLMLNAFRGSASYVALHSAEPEENDTHEVTESERIAINLTTPSDGEISSTDSVIFGVPGNTTIRFFGIWTDEVGGSLLGYGKLPTEETYNSWGTYTLAVIDMDLNHNIGSITEG